MTARIAELARGTSNTIPDIGLVRACTLAESFARWDEAAAMPTIKALMDACREKSLDRRNGQPDHGYGRPIAGFTLLRARTDDRGALDEYAAAHPSSFLSFEARPASWLGKLREFREKLGRAKGDARRGAGSDITWIVNDYNTMVSTAQTATQFSR